MAPTDEIIQRISDEHQKLAKKSPIEAKELFMANLRSWNLYGSTVFDVVQTFTNALPSSLWLAIHVDGIYMLEIMGRVNIDKLQKEPLINHGYASIQTISCSESSILIVMNETENSKKYVFETMDGEIIQKLISAYQNFKR